MTNIFNKHQKIIFSLSILAVLGLLVFNGQRNIMQVSAQNIPIIVNIGHLDYGNVFPGESLNKNFIVTYNGEDGQSVSYYIIQKHKPLPGAVPPPEYQGTIRQYCQDYPEDYSRCYRNLCPFITKVSQEGEGDEERGASVALSDLTDNWIVNLTVPAIIGNVAQAHGGGLVNEAGNYGCDISLNTDPTCGDNFCQTNENCSTCPADCGDCGDSPVNGNHNGGAGGYFLSESEILSDQARVLANISGPDLEMVKSVKVRQANPGSFLTYEIKITNNGSLTANNVSIDDQLPPGFSFIEGGGDTKNWQLKDILAGNSKSFIYTVKIGEDVKPGTYTNTATARADNNDKVLATARVEVNDVAVLGLELAPTGFRVQEFLLILFFINFLAVVIYRINKYSLEDKKYYQR